MRSFNKFPLKGFAGKTYARLLGAMILVTCIMIPGFFIAITFCSIIIAYIFGRSSKKDSSEMNL